LPAATLEMSASFAIFSISSAFVICIPLFLVPGLCPINPMFKGIYYKL
jgi:hypothetical protein